MSFLGAQMLWSLFNEIDLHCIKLFYALFLVNCIPKMTLHVEGHITYWFPYLETWLSPSVNYLEQKYFITLVIILKI